MRASEPALPVRRAPRDTWRLTWVLAALAAATSIVGLVHGGDGYYAPYPSVLAGLVGQDIATLIVGVPILIASALAARRGSVRGLLAWAGALFYLAYSYFFFVVGAFNAGFPAYAVIVGLSLYGLVSLLLVIDPDAVAACFATTTPRRLVGGYLMGIGALFVVMWGGLAVSAAVSGESPDPVVRLVLIADACVLLPALLAGGWKLWHGSAWGYVLGGILLVKVVLTSGTLVFTTALNAAWTGTLGSSDAFFLVLFGLMAVAALLLAVPYFRSADPRPDQGLELPGAGDTVA
jgi:hypothetical protein